MHFILSSTGHSKQVLIQFVFFIFFAFLFFLMKIFTATHLKNTACVWANWEDKQRFLGTRCSQLGFLADRGVAAFVKCIKLSFGVT